MSSARCSAAAVPSRPKYRAGWAKTYNEFQSWALKTRLKIPLIYGIDAVHGHNNIDGAVIFPHNIGMGATRNADLSKRLPVQPPRKWPALA